MHPRTLAATFAVVSVLVGSSFAPALADGARSRTVDAASVDGCTTITTPGEYVLATDVRNATAGACIRIRANDVALRGAGHAVRGGSGDAVSVGVLVRPRAGDAPLANVTVSNLTTAGWGFGVAYVDAVGGRVDDVTALGASRSGVALQRVGGVTVAATESVGNAQDGVLVLDSTDIGLTGVNASRNGFSGVELVDARNATASNVTADGNAAQGVRIANSSFTASDVRAANDGQFGVLLLGSEGDLNDVRAAGSGFSGVLVENARGVDLDGVAATENGQNGLFLLDSRNVTAVDVLTAGNALHGVSIANATGVAASNVTADGNGRDAVALFGGSDARLANVTARDSGAAAVRATGGSVVEGERVTAGATTVAFRARNASLSAVTSPPEPPADRRAVGAFVAATTGTADGYLLLSVQYEESAVAAANVPESSLELWRFDAGAWRAAGGSVDADRNRATANVTSLAGTVLAPLGTAGDGAPPNATAPLRQPRPAGAGGAPGAGPPTGPGGEGRSTPGDADALAGAVAGGA